MRQFPHLGLCNFPAWYSRQHLSKLLHRQYVANPETVAAAPVSGTTASTTPSEWFLCPSSCQQARQRRYGFHVTNLLVIVDQTIGDGKCHVAVTVCGQPDELKKKGLYILLWCNEDLGYDIHTAQRWAVGNGAKYPGKKISAALSDAVVQHFVSETRHAISKPGHGSALLLSARHGKSRPHASNF